MTTPGAFTRETVEKIWDRDSGRCVRCGRPQRFDQRGSGWSVHHRCPRGMGGTAREWIAGAANGIVLCGTGSTGCHGWVETHRTRALEDGMLISAHGTLTAEDVPLWHAQLGYVRLTDQGTTTDGRRR